MRVMDDLTKLRNHYYVEYMNKLNDKVEEQRLAIQRKTDQLNKRILMKELKEVQSSSMDVGYEGHVSAKRDQKL